MNTTGAYNEKNYLRNCLELQRGQVLLRVNKEITNNKSGSGGCFQTKTQQTAMVSTYKWYSKSTSGRI